MAEEIKSSGQDKQDQGGAITGDLSTILIGVGTLLDSTMSPISKIVAQALDSMTVVAKQILEGVSSTLGNNK
ncbi:MAG: hypothetical protein WCG19_04110 [Chlorobiaceae bacterium]